jgi:hypothetical protein
VIKEPRTDFGPHTSHLLSDVTGKIIGDGEDFQIRFTKVYRYDGHKVMYAGRYKSYLGQVEGEWHIGTYQGYFKIADFHPRPDQDFTPPEIMLLLPEVTRLQRGTRSIRPVQKLASGQHTIEVLGLAADNIKIADVQINGRPVPLETPTEREQNQIAGHAVRFSTRLPVQEGATPIRIVAQDQDGNQTEHTMTFDIQRARATEPSPTGSKSERASVYGKKIAVVIGINQYQNWPPLEFAVNDARSVERFLKEQQGFDTVIPLLDREATRTGILRVLGYELGQIAEPEDAVLVYFAGHGHTETLRAGGQEGYIVPVDSGTGDMFLSGISMRQLRSIVDRIKAKHILFVMDSCYSGLGFSRSAGVDSTETDYIHKIASFRAVQMITAGGMNEQVSERGGHGLFTHHFLQAATSGAADLDGDGTITGSEMGLYLRRAVSQDSKQAQTPQFGRFSGEGDFIFQTGAGAKQ